MTTVAPQALWTLNNEVSYSQAQQFAARLVRQYGTNASAWVNAAWRLALARPPSAQEEQEALSFMKALYNQATSRNAGDVPPKEFENLDPAQVTALTELCLTVFNLNEFAYID